MWSYCLRITYYVLNFFLVLSALIIISCTGPVKANSNNTGGNVTPSPPLNAASVIMGNITPIPLDGSGSNTTSTIITNNLPEAVYLNSAKITQNGTSTDVTSPGSSLVNLQLCQTIQDHGTCSVIITPPNTNGSFLLSIVFKTGGGKSYTASQVITYSNQIPSADGFYYSTLNSNIYNYSGQSTTFTIPFRLAQTYTSLKVEGNNPSFSASYSCPGSILTKGTLCTAQVLINNLGTTNLVIGSVTITGETSTLITDKAPLNKLKNFNNISNLKTRFSAKINLTVSQNTTGNLLTSAINVLVNPSTGNAQTVTLLNNGSASITNITIIPVSPIAVTNSGVGSCNAASGTLAAGASCTFTVNITTNTNVQSSVTINYNNGASSGNTNGTLSFNVIGVSANLSPGMTMTSGQGSLVGTAINSTVYYNILVANTGNVTLSNITFTNPSVYNAALSWDSSSTCPTSGIATLNVGQSCTLVIKFSPTAVIGTNTLTINSTATYTTSTGTSGTYNNASLAVSYSAINSVAFFYLTPNAVTYSIRADGSATQTQTYILTNGGGSSSTVGTIGISSTVTGFSIPGTGTCIANTTVLPANGSCTINTQYGTVNSAQSSISRTLNVTYLPSSGSPTATSFANLTFDASNAALVSVSNIAVTNTTIGNGTSGNPYLFTNTPLSSSQITAVITYSNTGTAAATNFNVALNTLPVGYSYNSGATTCGVGSNTTTLNASFTCDVSIFAVNPSGLSNSYALTGSLNFNIPGYSYTDTSTGLNTKANPTYSVYGNTVYVTANALAAVTSNSPTSSTASAGGSFNITFTASSSVAASLPITITIPGITTTNTNLIYATTSNTCTITTATGSCNINITNLSNAVAQTYSYNYTVSPNGSASGITQYLSFTLQ